MSFELFYRRLKRKALELYPSLNSMDSLPEFEQLFSPYTLELPREIFERAQSAISSLWRLSRDGRFQKEISCPEDWLKQAPSAGASVLMAYDFHSSIDGRVFLVEINTNAAGYLFSDLLYQVHELPPPLTPEPITSLRDSFFAEAKAWGLRPVQRAAIVDEDPPQQKMYGEFLMFKDLMKTWGWRADILDPSRLVIEEIDLIYSRLTDFYFNDSRLKPLLQSYLNQSVCLTPTPREYWLLADKERLADFATYKDLPNGLREVLIPTYELSHFGDNETLWAERKNLFFKPRRSYGGKSVYRGSSVSRKVFERILSEDYLAQQFVPAQSWPAQGLHSHLDNWRFDLRFFAYEDQVQLVVARSYQGQVTNFASQYGGWTALKFV